MCACMRVHRKHGAHVKLRGGFSGVSSLLTCLTCESPSPGLEWSTFISWPVSLEANSLTVSRAHWLDQLAREPRVSVCLRFPIISLAFVCVSGF